jgi:hypothetical protein
MFFSVLYIHAISLDAYHPYSASLLSGNAARIYGEYARFVTIPSERKEGMEKLLAKFKIKSENQVDQGEGIVFSKRKDDLSLLIRQAGQEGNFTPSTYVKIFIPYLGPLEK